MSPPVSLCMSSVAQLCATEKKAKPKSCYQKGGAFGSLVILLLHRLATRRLGHHGHSVRSCAKGLGIDGSQVGRLQRAEGSTAGGLSCVVVSRGALGFEGRGGGGARGRKLLLRAGGRSADGAQNRLCGFGGQPRLDGEIDEQRRWRTDDIGLELLARRLLVAIKKISQ